MKVLDLFCGMGGWSIGFHREGFDCVGLDIVDVGYPYEFIQEDIRDFHPNGDRFDVVTASPPCVEFSNLTKGIAAMPNPKRGPPDPEKGLILVREVRRLLDEINPQYWIVENVEGARKHFYPIFGKPSFVNKPWFLWGNFPKFMMPYSNRLYKTTDSSDKSILNQRNRFDPLASWKRSRIPIALSLQLAKACKSSVKMAERK
jgi:hypothetical protein